MKSRLRRVLQPGQLLPAVTAGLVVGVIDVIVEVSLAALIFSGDLAGLVPRGIGLALFGAMVAGFVGAVFSSYPGTIVVPQDAPAVILALMAASIVAAQPETATLDETFILIVVTIILTTVLAGLFFLAIGALNLGQFVRYIPYPVVGGFLAGTGWMLFKGGMGVMADVPLSLTHLPALLQGDVLIRWLPGLLFAVALAVILRRRSHFLIVPGMLLGAIALFYALLWITRTPVTVATDQGWLLGPFPQGGLWSPLSLQALSQVDWPAILAQAGSGASMLIISLISFLLNASGIELTTGHDVDLNHELRAVGLANVAAGLGGGPVSYPSLSLSVLGHRLGTTSRVVGLVSVGVYGVMLFLGAPILSFFPRPILGGLILFLGLDFLIEWVYDAWSRLPWTDYAIIILILVTMDVLGILAGVGLGIGMAVLLFIVNYSRVAVVKHALSGTSYRSNVDRPPLYRQLLHAKGHWLYVLELQSFIFFGTAHMLLEQVRRRIDDPTTSPPRFILLDFRQVTGLDASAVFSFARMRQYAQGRDITLVFTHLSPEMRRRMEREVLTPETEVAWRVFEDLDHGLEWCEEEMIDVFESTGVTARPRTVRQQLERSLPRTERLANLLEFLAQEPEGDPALTSAPVDELIPGLGLDRGSGLENYLTRMEVEAGCELIRQGDAPEKLYFVESGQLIAQVTRDDGQIIRLRKMGAGTVVGEIGMYGGTDATATVVTTEPSTVYALSAEGLERMEREDPDIAVVFHKFIAQLLSGRLSMATATMEALLA